MSSAAARVAYEHGVGGRYYGGSRRPHILRNWCWLPLLSTALGFATIASTYVWSTTDGKEVPWLPTISDTGAERPESSLFTLGLTLFGGAAALTMFVMYRWLADEALRQDASGHVRRAAFAFLVTGWLSVLGVCVLSTFQVRDFTKWIHNVAAMLAFLFGAVQQGVLVVMQRRLGVSRATWWLRAPLFGITVVAMVGFYVLLVPFHMLKLVPSFNGLPWAALCEYIMVSAFFLYYGTYSYDLWRVRVAVDVIDATAGGGGGGRGRSASSADLLSPAVVFADDDNRLL